METLDLHPEELFDKAAQGLASRDELARLDAHLASCATCRFERQVRADFDSVVGSTAEVDDLVARALSGAGKVAEAPRRRRVGPMVIAATVALMGFGSFAAVAQFTGLLPRLFERGREADRVRVPAPEPAPSRVPVPAPAPVVAQEAVLALSPTLSPPSGDGPAERWTSAAEAKRKMRQGEATQEAGEREAMVRRPSSSRSPSPPVPTPAPVEPDALALFSSATQARVNGDPAAAIRDFRTVIARFPASPEAALSHAALGRLLLDRGEAASALEAFDAYLASPDQVLREDLQGARALALQALGRVDDERTAWEAVLRDYPSGVYAPRARTRLESLAP